MKKTMIITGTLLLVVLFGIVAILQHPAFGRSPRAERLARILQSPNYRDNQFQNLNHTPVTTAEGGRLKTMWDFLFGERPDLKPETALPVGKFNLHTLDRSEDLLVWFGHSSYFIQSNGKRFLIDPVLTSEFPMNLMFQPFKGTDGWKPEDIPEIDFLIITHEHWDHLDYGTLKEIRNRTAKVICPLGVGEYLEYWKFPADDIIEMDWYDQYQADETLTIHCLPARHYSNRLFKQNQTLWASFMIEAAKTIYISGDSGYDSHYAEIGNRFPHIDLAILENGQYDKDWRHIHMMPDKLPLAVKDLNPKQVFTTHHGKYALCKHTWFEPLNNALQLSELQISSVLMPQIGEGINPFEAETQQWW